MATVLFMCLQNAGRSQMAKRCFSAPPAMLTGRCRPAPDPAERVHPEVVEVMRELDIDIADRIPQQLTSELAERADLVVTMGCGDQCPYIPGKRYIDWELPDPAGQPLDRVREIRDLIVDRTAELAAAL